MKFFKKYIKKYCALYITAVLFLSGEAFCDLMQPKMMSKIIDVGVRQRNEGYVIHTGIIMIVITLIGAVCACTRNVLASRVSQKFGAELRFDLFKKIQSFSFTDMDKFQEASLITRLTNDVTQIQNFANGLMRIFMKAPILCVGSIFMAITINPAMGAVVVIIVPVVVILISINLKIGYPFFVKIQKAVDKINGVMREYLSGVRVVKAFNRFDFEKNKFEHYNDELCGVNTSALRTMAVFSPAINFTVNMGIIAILWLSGYGVKTGNVKVGQVMALANYMTQILFSLSIIANVFMVFVRAKASVQRINAVFSEEDLSFKEGLETDKNEQFINSSDEIAVEFNNVCFSYDKKPENAVLKNLNFSCKKGETIGIIGSTGSGKTTLTSLIPGFYYPTSGTIKVNGSDIKRVSPELLKQKIAIVPQKTVLFSGTIEKNIRWGKEDADLDEIETVCKISEAHEFISKFPEQYKTNLGQTGVNLSGGQKQRVSIARALIKKPSILILDDCTSAVDLITERKIREGLKGYIKNLTCFIIAQRITSVMNSDKIIVLDEGEIAGIGTHEELLKSCKVYNDIFISQMGREN